MSDGKSLEQELADARRIIAERDTTISHQHREISDRTTKLNAATINGLASQELAVDNALAAGSNEMDVLEAKLVAFNEAGDFKGAAATQREMVTVSAKITDNQNRKTYLAAQRERAKSLPVEQVPDDGLTEPARNWIRNNPRFESDAAFKDRAIRADAEARFKGIAVDTPEYFKMVEDRAYEREIASAEEPEIDNIDDDEVTVAEVPTPKFVPVNARAREPQPRAAGPGAMASVATTPTRSVVGGQSGQRQTRQLTPEQADAAVAQAATLAPNLTNLADIYKWYADLYDSPRARAKRQGWAA